MSEPLVGVPTAYEVATFLGGRDDPALREAAEIHLPLVAALARSYTRGQGFGTAPGVCTEDIAAVLTAATARSASNPEQDRRIEFDGYSSVPTTGWTLVETAVLNRYRRRAQ